MYKDNNPTYFILQLELQEEAEGSFATTIDIVDGFYTELKAASASCNFEVKLASAAELQIAERPRAFFVLVSSNQAQSLRELAEQLLSCVERYLQDFRVLLPFEDGAKLAPNALDSIRWADIGGFLDIQVEHGKKPKFKLLIS